ncbi:MULTISPECIES: thiamine phosphate synthase [unclassified Olleya]|jgi:thiamine-phosphate pyrophosphorylase|uniref:thiamine phosphate synthase n=1 Tax=unclassified Olleya TaxID=2615019 RepID=UPI0011A9BF9C|nr:thiamine phosphate synthase [Olleya sp. Hel_I_94]TVZ46501.1 thiamine-phosphate pyrophosphorylase [Olleya sp. Hel_I_94]
MIIPKLHYITQGETAKQILENVQKACTSGAELVQLRYKNVSEKKFLKLAEAVIKITSHYQTRLIINDHYKLAKTIKADGVHLGPSDTCPTIARKHLYTWQSIGGTANTLEDCETLITKEVDYISLGPFRFTDTKANVGPILGLEGYTAIMDVLNTTTPIIGVGGITTSDIEAILKTGISGVAVSSQITKNFESIKTFNQLLKASVIAEQRHTFE